MNPNDGVVGGGVGIVLLPGVPLPLAVVDVVTALVVAIVVVVAAVLVAVLVVQGSVLSLRTMTYIMIQINWDWWRRKTL